MPGGAAIFCGARARPRAAAGIAHRAEHGAPRVVQRGAVSHSSGCADEIRGRRSRRTCVSNAIRAACGGECAGIVTATVGDEPAAVRRAVIAKDRARFAFPLTAVANEVALVFELVFRATLDAERMFWLPRGRGWVEAFLGHAPRRAARSGHSGKPRRARHGGRASRSELRIRDFFSAAGQQRKRDSHDFGRKKRRSEGDGKIAWQFQTRTAVTQTACRSAVRARSRSAAAASHSPICATIQSKNGLHWVAVQQWVCRCRSEGQR